MSHLLNVTSKINFKITNAALSIHDYVFIDKFKILKQGSDPTKFTISTKYYTQNGYEMDVWIMFMGDRQLVHFYDYKNFVHNFKTENAHEIARSILDDFSAHINKIEGVLYEVIRKQKEEIDLLRAALNSSSNKKM